MQITFDFDIKFSFIADVFMTITRLEGSSTLTITVNLNGENEREMTRILSEDENTNYHMIEYPFDFQIRLKVRFHSYWDMGRSSFYYLIGPFTPALIGFFVAGVE